MNTPIPDYQDTTKKRRTAIHFIAVFLVLLLIGLGLLIYFTYNSYISRYQNMNGSEISQQDLDKLPVKYIGNVSKIQKPAGVYNIILFGLDTRDKKQFASARSDVIILATLDTVKKEIKMTSFMRDCLVDIPGHGKNKLTSAFNFGGPALAVQTLQNNFGIDIDWYAIVNFWSMAEIIDTLGGVKVNVTADEVTEININLVEINADLPKSEQSPNLKSTGIQTLNGKQAVGYMRIRHLTGGDFKRTERQRTVMKGLIASFKSMTLDKLLSLVDIIPDYIRTNMSVSDMLNMAKTFYSMRSAAIEELRIPIDGGYTSKTYNDMDVLQLDTKANFAALKKFLEQ